MNYRENKEASFDTKNNYLSGINKLIDKWKKDGISIRDEYIKDIFINQEKYREEFKRMLGRPLLEARIGIPNAKFNKIAEEEEYLIYRITFDILDDFNMSGLLFKIKSESAEPLIIAQHGGLGTPEFVSGLYGDSSNYNDMISRILKYHVNVFAPQLLIWDKEEYKIEFDRHRIDSSLKRVGSSIAALEIYGITRIIDYFEMQDYVKSFGMIGLSYGGFYTMFTAAIDTRIKSVITCSQFNNRDVYDWVDWTWKDSALKFSDAEIACLVYPRKLCIAVGNNDKLFDINNAFDEYERLKELSSSVGCDWINFVTFEGIHEFYKSDKPIEKLINDIKS